MRWMQESCVSPTPAKDSLLWVLWVPRCGVWGVYGYPMSDLPEAKATVRPHLMLSALQNDARQGSGCRQKHQGLVLGNSSCGHRDNTRFNKS